MLHRERYVGRATWGRYKKYYRGGTEKRARQDTVIIAQRPDLRIVSDELWDAVHKRLAAMRGGYIRSCNGQLYGRPDKGLASRYLLSGLMRCAECGGSLVALTSGHPQGTAEPLRLFDTPQLRLHHLLERLPARPRSARTPDPRGDRVHTHPRGHIIRHRAGGYPVP